LQNKTIAWIGLNADATQEMQEDYHSRAPFIIDSSMAFKSLTAGMIETKTFHFDDYSYSQVNRSIWNFSSAAKSRASTRVVLQRPLKWLI
jgi:hypothetical protein